MGGGVPGHALQGTGHIDEPMYLLIGLVQITELLAQTQGIVQRYMQCTRPAGHQLGDHIHLRIGNVQRTAYIPNGGAGRHRAKGNDLCHMVIAVFAPDIVHHFTAPQIPEVHINIGHGHTLRIQKALKIKVELHGINVRNMQAIGHHAACRAAAAGAHGNTRAFGIADKVRHDQKVIGKAHALDHVQLVCKLLAVALLSRTIALGKTVIAQLAQVGTGIVAIRRFELRQVVFTEGKFQPAAVCNTLRVFHRVGIGGKQCLHLLGGTQIEILRLIAHTVFIVHRLAGLNTQQHIMAGRIFLAQIVGIVGTHQRNPRVLMQAQQLPIHRRLFVDTVILQFQIEIALSQYFLHL